MYLQKTPQERAALSSRQSTGSDSHDPTSQDEIPLSRKVIRLGNRLGHRSRRTAGTSARRRISIGPRDSSRDSVPGAASVPATASTALPTRISVVRSASESTRERAGIRSCSRRSRRNPALTEGTCTRMRSSTVLIARLMLSTVTERLAVTLISGPLRARPSSVVTRSPLAATFSHSRWS